MYMQTCLVDRQIVKRREEKERKEGRKEGKLPQNKQLIMV